jgi:hypothetical protein
MGINPRDEGIPIMEEEVRQRPRGTIQHNTLTIEKGLN